MNDEQMKLLSQAVAVAAKAHSGQKRKDGTPYIYHPVGVAVIVKDGGYGLEYQTAAVLHDILEDTDTKEEFLLSEFGAEITEAVKVLTREKGSDEAEYVRKVLGNRIAAVVKNADKIHNLQEVMGCGDDKFRRWYVKKSEKYYFGKFSPALDNMIRAASKRKAVRAPATLRLYAAGSVREEKLDETGPLNVKDPGNVYYIDGRMEDTYICVPGYEADAVLMRPVSVYVLTKDGWEPGKRDIMADWTEYYEISRQQMEEEIRNLQKEGWFRRNIDKFGAAFS